MQSVQVVHGRKKTRGELRLPQLHFIAMDQWEDAIGWKAIRAWLKLYTLADRKNSDMDIVPNSMENIRKILGVGGSTFYPQIIKPLWNYGFIDLQEVTIKNNILVNIIVYEYPGNDPARATMLLEKLRDYDTDYHSTKRDKVIKSQKKQGKKAPSTDTVELLPSTQTVEPLYPDGRTPSTDTVENNVLNTINVLNTHNETNISQSVIESEAVKLAIGKRKKLMDRLTDIEQVYQSVKNEKGYSDALFISTLQKAAKARVKGPFTQYLLKAMINNMKEQNAGESTKSKKDLPEWVKNQTKSPLREATASIDPDEQRQALDLLFQLNEIDREQYETQIKALEAFENDL